MLVSLPPSAMLTSTIEPTPVLVMSRRKTSLAPLASATPRLPAKLVNATQRPSALMLGSPEPPLGERAAGRAAADELEGAGRRCCSGRRRCCRCRPAGSVVSPSIEVAGARGEDDERAVVVDLGLERLGVADRAGRGVLADQRRRVVDAVAQEDVGLAVGVAGDEVVGGAGEHDVAAVAADGRLGGVAVARAGAGEVDADQVGGQELPVFERLNACERTRRDTDTLGHGA